MIKGKTKQFKDSRGILTAFSIDDIMLVMPNTFSIRRIFYVSNVPAQTTRGNHAHKKDWQVLCCLSGRIDLTINSKHFNGVVAMMPGNFYVMEPLTWVSQLYYMDSTLLVLCSEPYDESDYIRNYDEFKKLAGI